MDYVLDKENYLQKLKERCILKGFSNQTIKSYSYNVEEFLDFINKSRLNLSNEEVKLYLLAQNLSVNSSRLQYASVSFFFREILNKPFSFEEIPIKKKEAGEDIKINFIKSN